MNSVLIKLFNMNEQIVESTSVIELEKELKDEFEYMIERGHFFKKYGLLPVRIELQIFRKNVFIEYILSSVFKNYNIIDCQNIGITGHPDFKLINKENPLDEIYLELKIENDALSQTQLEWFYNNKDKKCKVIWMSYDIHHFNINYNGL